MKMTTTLGFCAVLLLSACAGDSASDDTSPATTAGADSTDEPAAEAADTAEDATGSDGADASGTGDGADGDAAEATLTVATDPGVEPSRPILSWPAVPAAARYEVMVWSATGELYWAWQGTETTVPIGGSPQLGPNSAGPALAPGMVWAVVAIDAGGFIVGQSAPVKVS